MQHTVSKRTSAEVGRCRDQFFESVSKADAPESFSIFDAISVNWEAPWKERCELSTMYLCRGHIRTDGSGVHELRNESFGRRTGPGRFGQEGFPKCGLEDWGHRESNEPWNLRRVPGGFQQPAAEELLKREWIRDAESDGW